jgi:hypothetical protein
MPSSLFAASSHCSVWTTILFVNACNAAQIAIDGIGSVSKYQVPLKNCDADNILPDQCTVYLAKGITIDEHKKRVGQPWQDSSIRVVFDRDFSDNVWYSTKMDAESLAVIRGDEGVSFVECNVWYSADLE